MNFLLKSIKAAFYFLLFVVCFYGLVACVENDEIKTGGPYFYERVEMKQQSDFPLRPVRILTEEATKTMQAYGIAHYDKQGRIVSYTKMLDGKVDWSSKFYYSSAGHLEKEEYLSPNKELIQKYYDKSGLLIRSEPKRISTPK